VNNAISTKLGHDIIWDHFDMRNKKYLRMDPVEIKTEIMNYNQKRTSAIDSLPYSKKTKEFLRLMKREDALDELFKVDMYLRDLVRADTTGTIKKLHNVYDKRYFTFANELGIADPYLMYCPYYTFLINALQHANPVRLGRMTYNDLPSSVYTEILKNGKPSPSEVRILEILEKGQWDVIPHKELDKVYKELTKNIKQITKDLKLEPDIQYCVGRLLDQLKKKDYAHTKFTIDDYASLLVNMKSK
jgi:hypothetical protein